MNQIVPALLTAACITACITACIGGCEVIEDTGDAIGLTGGKINHSDIDTLLDNWHHAAAVGDLDTYIHSMTEGSIFMGTDESERWTRDQLQAYAEKHFVDGSGWTYTPRDRFVSTNAYGDVAWVDETLDNTKYGILRGTAVLRKNGDDWRIAHYSLTFLIPNDAAGSIVDLIESSGSTDSGG